MGVKLQPIIVRKNIEFQNLQGKTSIKNIKLISGFKDLNSNKISQLVFCRGIVSGISQVKTVNWYYRAKKIEKNIFSK